MNEPTSIDREIFLLLLAERFPDIASSISEFAIGLLHPEMGEVAHATRTAIASGAWTIVGAHFQFIERIFANGDDSVRNAVYVSYLENVLLGESSQEFNKAKLMLPPLLMQAFTELEAHFDMLSSADTKTARQADGK